MPRSAISARPLNARPGQFGATYARCRVLAQKLGDAELGLPGARLLNLIRAKTMKKGGVGYVQPGKGSFPLMADMNRFVLESGAIPRHLAGRHGRGREEPRGTVRHRHRAGAAALNIIPDRNYTPGVKDQKLKNLYDVVEMAEKHHLDHRRHGDELPGQQVRGFLRDGGTGAAGAGFPAGRAYHLRTFGFAAPERAGVSESVGEEDVCRRDDKNEFLSAWDASCSPRAKTCCAA